MKRLVRITFAALFLIPSVLFAQTSGSLTLTTQINSDGTLTPTLSWRAPTGATSCTASGPAGWAGTKAVTGTQTLAPFPSTSPRLYFMTCSGAADTTAMLSWTPPTTFESIDHDNNPSTPPVAEPLPICPTATDPGACLAKYRIHHGTSADVLSDVRDHNFPNSTSANWTGLSAGEHFFAIRAVTGQGAQSVLSNIQSRTITGSIQWSQATGVRAPAAPVLQ